MIRSLLIFVLTLTLLATPSLHAQSQGAAAANSQAYELFAAGDYTNAAAAYEKLLKDYPTDAIVISVAIQLAYCYYLNADFAKADAALARARSGPPLGADLSQSADILTAQIALAKAGALPTTDPKRKAAFDDAAKRFGDFIAKYPQSPDIEMALSSKAIAEYQNQSYDAAIKDLELSIQKFAKSPTIASSKQLLAITLATQAGQQMKSGADNSAALALSKRATDLLSEIITKKEDISLINDANFQLGQILMSEAGFSPAAEQPALLKEALAAFSAVAPKEEIVALEQAKIKTYPDLRRKAILAKNEALRKQIDRENERELKKLAELQAKPDQVAVALQKMGEIYFQQQNYNAARVVFQHVTPFLAEPAAQKENLYYLTMTYALQNVADKAQANYTEFNGKFKADPIADNLPITLGQMYLNLGKPDDAIRLFDESTTIYPNGRFVGLSVVNKATAEMRQGKLDDALRTFQSQLGKPNLAPEIGVVAQSGLADIYRGTQKWDDAITAYKTVKDKYPGTVQATNAEYWIGICTQQKGDYAGAIPLLEAFVKANPQSPLAPVALYTQGASQINLGQKDAGYATLTTLAKDYAQSPPATFSFFTRAQLRGQEGKGDEVLALMHEFIKLYPKDEKIYSAYDTIAQAQSTTGKPAEAIATYREFSQAYPDSPKASEALVKIADLQLAQAKALGRYGALSEQEKTQWKTAVDGSIATIEELIKKYPESPDLSVGLRSLLADERLLLDAGIKQPADVEKYFQSLSDAVASAGAKSKLQFALAGYVSDQDKARALTIMTASYKPDVIYAPQDLEAYGLALLTEKKLDEANAVFEKLAKDYAIPAGVPQGQVPLLTQEAQAISLFGKGRVLQEKGQTAEAGAFFQQLKTLYPWSPKVLDANYGIAAALKQQGKLDDAVPLVTGIIQARDPNIPPELRAKTMLLGGDIWSAKAAAATNDKDKGEALGAAIDYYVKIAGYYGGVKDAAARGLWLGAQLIEQQAGASSDAAFKKQQLDKAKLFYQQLVKDYPQSEFAAKAQERLTALGGAK